MIRSGIAALLYAAAAVAAVAAALPAVAAEPPFPKVVPGAIAVRFREAAPGGVALREWVTPQGVRVGLTPVVSAASPASRSLRPGAATLPDDGIRGWMRVTLPPGVRPEDAAHEWAAMAGVAAAEPIRLIPLAAAAALPADPDLDGQWQHEAIGSAAAWSSATGEGVVIAIVDTGIDLTQEDLAPNLWENPAEAAGEEGVDDDGNGFIDDRNGWDFTDVPEIIGSGDYRDRDADPTDDVGHGTWVAGAAAARGDNGIGGAGVAYRARIMPLRAGFQPGVGFSLGFLAEDDAAAAIVYAVDNGADIVNLSFGDVVRSPILEEAVRYAVDRGVVVVAASGNSGDDIPFQPASLAGVLAVGASTRERARAGFSAFGPSVRLLAPGSGVLTTDVGGGMTSKSGTSLASPVAAGAIALLKQVHPEWSAARLIDALYASSDETAAPVEAAYGARLLRINAALGVPGEAEIRLDLDEGTVVDAERPITGSVFGPGVRGWRVLARPLGDGPWQTLRAEPSRPAWNEPLAMLLTSGEPETTWVVRVEALGLDQVLASRERRVRIDHSPPAITDLAAEPVLSTDPVTGAVGYGVRVSALADEPVFGRLTLAPASGGLPPLLSQEPPRFERTLSSVSPVLGVDQPLVAGSWEATVSYRNDAGLITEREIGVTIPTTNPERPTKRGAPDAATYLPRLVDLDGDGRLELVGESRLRTGAFYGNLRAWRTTDGEPAFEEAWRSEERGIPRDTGDFDGDGRPDLLVLSLQKATVFTSRMPGGFPNFKLAEISDGWAALFIPSAGGIGLDIVTSFNTSIRIFRRQESGVVQDQELANPGTGINSISPAIVRLNDDGDGIGLATIDGDGDLLIARRGGDGRFAWSETIALGPSFLSEIAAADLDGDGRSEIALIEAIGDVPSPTVALRDGFYRLRVLRRGEDGGYHTWRQLAVAGQFPGNPVHLEGGIPRPSGGDYLWMSLGGRAYRLSESGGSLSVDAVVEGVGDGPPAWGLVSSGPVTSPWTIFPTAAGITPPDDDLVSATLITDATLPPGSADSGVIALVARYVGAGPNGARIRLEWAGGAVDAVVRERIGSFELPVIRSHVQGTTTFTDSTAMPDAHYRYRLLDDAETSASIDVTVQPTNPIVQSQWDGRRLILTWTRAIRATESARLLVVPAGAPSGATPVEEAVASSLLDSDGRRLIVELAPGLTPGGAYRLEMSGYVSASNLVLEGADAVADFTASGAEDDGLRLVRVIAVNNTTLIVELSPGAPASPAASHFEIVDGPAVVAAVRESDTRVRLTLMEPMSGRDQRIRLLPGAVGPEGETVHSGAADVLPFRLGPVAYPNPARAGAPFVRFDWLPYPARVRVRDLAGREIWSGDADAEGSASWPLAGSVGGGVAPGVYLWQVDGHESYGGKLAVLR